MTEPKVKDSKAAAPKKYTVLVGGRLGNVGDVVNLHPRQATFLMTSGQLVEGEKKGKALDELLGQHAQLQTPNVSSENAKAAANQPIKEEG
ncbi:Uncharacterised protein [BD1-7 clade bacterium]|uniref:Uncharacterized protein n=1 Tax=BD1-7 clade bacterium TaxID=2029982 RepID=A0A5S9Q3M4_9GAMM|nr:Uncharacterised protein [BD1-7 clade bacterium]CAA0111833.1 Uncharacterised protein [BD1-7 clade bacterium]